MYFKQFLHDDHGCASYFIASRASREAAVVDPQVDVDPYLDLAAERGYRITTVIDTHLHADHVSGNRALARATGATVRLHSSAEVAFAFAPLEDEDVLPLGQLRLQVLHTPGHRIESISLLVVNPPRSPEPSMVLSGDTLFVGDVGRPDFGGDEGAEQQWSSVQRLLTLPDWVEVFPAHFEGSCGKAMCGRPSSTIGFERRFNPVLALSRQEFLTYARQPPARPLNMTAIMATNQGRADLSHAQELGTPTSRMSVAEMKQLVTDGAVILDVREPAEYAGGHVPGARNLPQAELLTRIDEIPRDRKLILVCESGNRSQGAARFLARQGYEDVADVIGGTSAWRRSGEPLEPSPTG
ncbi:MAG: MBL fold metallo-hydrolase [Microlunatus sp.]|nr:MBL fold metallo-hydrolase [Microlunatus sp.]MDN5770573.1 MBL fold metallo-hydrolase [Microlunatus sp.]